MGRLQEIVRKMSKAKRVFGKVEAVFDLCYLLAAALIGVYILCTGVWPVQRLAGYMAVLLVAGDGFHLVPRMLAIVTGKEERFSKAMGAGKLITSITMTGYYVLLWHIGLLLFELKGGFWHSGTLAVYVLAGIRILLCVHPKNQWLQRHQPVNWGIYRNIPFIILGGLTAILFAVYKGQVPPVNNMWIAIILSFVFYLPVVLWVHKKPAIGMLMLPKTCTYIWMLTMCLFL